MLTDLKLFGIILMLRKDEQQTHDNLYLGHRRRARGPNTYFNGIYFFTLSSLLTLSDNNFLKDNFMCCKWVLKYKSDL